ncbi:MAG: HAD family hydrolase [Melioribacteraceae bacterium]|nr:HAD family hydrolase [Melioribacteraceae bacterium]
MERNQQKMKRTLPNIKVISFDADDTLWVNEPYFREAEVEICAILNEYGSPEEITRKILRTESRNLPFYGYGIKGFILSVIETAIEVTERKIHADDIAKIIKFGHELMQKPVILLDDVETVLQTLTKRNFKLIVATKGDLMDQERKLRKSGLAKYFHHIEIMSNKKESDYRALLSHLEIKPENFLMIGNSLKSDILPVLAIGGKAFHIPFHTTWEHEEVRPEEIENLDIVQFENLSQILESI